MPNMNVSIPHRLTRAEAKRRIQEHILVLRKEHSAIVTKVQESWKDDRMDFAVTGMGQTISGHLTVDDQMVHLEVALPWLLSILAGTIKHRIELQGGRVLGQLGQDTPKRG